MDVKQLGVRLRMIRKHLGIRQQQVAEATILTQPTVSRLENGEEVYASALLAVLGFYQDKVSLDYLLDSTLDTDNERLYCCRHEMHQRIERQLAVIAHSLDESLEQMAALRNEF